MAADSKPSVAPVVVADVDLEKQMPVPAEKIASVSEKDAKKQSAGVVVTVMPLGDGVLDSPDMTPRTSVHNLGVFSDPAPVSEKKAVGDVDDDEEKYPDGGLRAWLVVVGAWFGCFGSMGILNSVSVFNAYISENQLGAYPASTTGWIWSVFTFLTLLPGVFMGPIFDAHGPTWLIWPGSITMVLGVVLASFATQYWHFMLSISVVTGISSSMVYSPCIPSVGHWFKERRALAMGIVGTGSVSAGIVLPLLLQNLLPKIGWAWTMRALALLQAVCLLTACLLVRTRLPPVPSASMIPSLKIFKNRAFLVYSIADFFMELALYSPINYLSSFALASGISSSMSFTIISILNASSVVGRIMPGFVAPKVGAFNQLVATCLLAAVVVMGILFPVGHMLGGLIAFALVYGLCSGNVMTLLPLCVSKLCDTRQLGSHYAGMYLIVSWGYLFGTPMCGAIIGAAGYKAIFILSAALWLASMVSYFAVRTIKFGWKMSIF